MENESERMKNDREASIADSTMADGGGRLLTAGGARRGAMAEKDEDGDGRAAESDGSRALGKNNKAMLTEKAAKDELHELTLKPGASKSITCTYQ
eukprot:SAG22_NODE_12638_length_435_cov_0.708333_1_plen_94_part_10